MYIQKIMADNSGLNAVRVINTLEVNELSILLAEVTVALNADKPLEEFANKTFFLKALQASVIRRLPLEVVQKYREDAEVEVSSISTVLSAYQYQQYCLNINWEVFFKVCEDHKYFINTTTLSIVQYFNNKVVTLQYKKPMHYWMRVAEIAILRHKISTVK